MVKLMLKLIPHLAYFPIRSCTLLCCMALVEEDLLLETRKGVQLDLVELGVVLAIDLVRCRGRAGDYRRDRVVARSVGEVGIGVFGGWRMWCEGRRRGGHRGRLLHWR